MRLGIDFGTSYSAAGAVVGDGVELLTFGEEKQFRTTAYFQQQVPDPSQFTLSPALEAEVDSLVRKSRNDQTRQAHRAGALRARAMQISNEAGRERELGLIPNVVLRSGVQMRQEAVSAVRRRWLEEQVRTSRASAASLQNAVYGDQAIEAYLAEGGGHLVDSPKSMLGFALGSHARAVLLRIATYVLEHIRLSAVQQLETDVRSALIGRPVRFRSSIGDAGGLQALAILREAAAAAGFDDVEFLEEPAAAAMGYHATQKTAQRCLVVDIGGGTTDIAMAKVGGRRSRPEILGSWGTPMGGQDVDLDLSLANFMQLLGKGRSRIPVHLFSDAARVHEVHRQADFMRHDFSRYDQPYADRLRRLQAFGNTVRLNRQVEITKKLLSERNTVAALLDFIEEDLVATATQQDLSLAAERYLDVLAELLETARADIAQQPEVILLTGGMSRAPYVQAAVRAIFPGVAVTRGDPSLGVVTGLAVAANRARAARK
ncbi:heat-shock protein Hsp70 [Thermomonas carbonis]|uniref:Hsp70 family protein n=1 Tax=Thermomonas carbonis TaxID=1463158 RepID=UPI00167A9C53|nr:Hsp70 family protein [Thermomonas carbonis]GHB97407.1 heat-shock protein Hsp70 [Thermomonas carbonis]